MSAGPYPRAVAALIDRIRAGSRRPFGIHLPNDMPINDDHWNAIRRIDPDLILVCEPHFSLVPEIRRAASRAVVIGRFYGAPSLGIDAWNPPYGDGDRMRAYGAYCAEVGSSFDIDIVQYANEPFNESGLIDVERGHWELIALGARMWADGFLSARKRPILSGTIPLSPGRREDDHERFGTILRPSWHLHDVLLLHNYIYGPESVGADWGTRRHVRQRDVYQWTGLWAIAEFNRDPGRSREPGLEYEATRLVDDATESVEFLGAAWFILDSRDESFREMRLIAMPTLIDAASRYNEEKSMAKRQNREYEIRTTPTGGGEIVGQIDPALPGAEPGMPLPDLVIDPIAPAICGQPHRITARLVTPDGAPSPFVGVAVAQINADLGPDGVTAIFNGQVKFDPELAEHDVDGVIVIDWTPPLPNIPFVQAGCEIALTFANPAAAPPFKTVHQRFALYPAAGFVPEAPPAEPVTVPPAPSTEDVPKTPDGVRLDRIVYMNARIFDIAGALQIGTVTAHPAGLYIHRLYQWGKGETDEVPQDPRFPVRS